jgi:DNA-binding beta-propeller fold protein YncE
VSERSTLRPRLLATLLVVSAAILGPATAQGADRIYWANFGSPERISFANVDGSGGVDLNTAGALVKIPFGLALDPAGGRAYWSNETSPGGISFANLDGSGAAGNLNTGSATVKGTSGAAIDPVARRIYWSNIGEGNISWANLDGSGGGNLFTGTAGINGPYGLEVDPVGRKVYWTNSGGGGGISWANLDGSGGGNLQITGSATLESPIGLAIDPVGKRIYWANAVVSGKISYANLDGSGSADVNTTGATVSSPYGVAVDPDAHRVYWANSSGGLGYADTSGSGGANLQTAPGFAAGSPNFPNLLEVPRPSAIPALTASSAKPGATLGCTPGGWAGDVSSASLYRAPTAFSYEWSRSGAPIVGATTATLTGADVGAYRCKVTASNPAGAASQTSAVTPVFKVGKPKLNRKKGTAKLPVTLPVSGRLGVTGQGFKATTRQVAAAGTLKLTIRAKGKSLKKLRRSGKAKLALTLAFTTFDGGVAAQARSVLLHTKK